MITIPPALEAFYTHDNSRAHSQAPIPLTRFGWQGFIQLSWWHTSDVYQTLGFSLSTQLHVLLQTNVHVLGWHVGRIRRTLVCAIPYHKQSLLFHRERKFLKFNFLLQFIFNNQTLLNSMYTTGPLVRKKLFEKHHDQNSEDCCQNLYVPVKSTSEIWTKFNRVFWKQTTQPHQEYLAFLSVRMASFNPKVDKGKALKGKRQEGLTSEAHTPKLKAALVSLARGRDSSTSRFSCGGFETLNLLCGEIPHGNAGKGATKHWFVICYFLHRDKQLYLHAETQEQGAKMRNINGTTAFRDCFCTGYFVSYI